MSQLVLLDMYPVLIEGSVVALHRKPERGEIVKVPELEAVGGKGFVGDYSFGKRRRQASVVSTLETAPFGYAPGVLRENVTVDFPGLQSLPEGHRLYIGDVVLEIVEDCEPCSRMAKRLREDPARFVRKMAGKRGMLCKVRSSGTIRVGDRVQVRGG